MTSHYAVLTGQQDADQGRVHPLRHWLSSHWQSLCLSITTMLRTPLNSTVTLTVIAIAMTLPAGLFILLNNLHQLSRQWQGTPTISLYLKHDANTAKLIKTLKRHPQIAQVQYISPKAGLKEFAEKAKLQSVVASLSENPLPSLVIISPQRDAESPELLKLLYSQVRQLPDVEIAQMDSAWVQRLYYFVTLGERLVYTLGFLFALGVILVVSNTIRLILEDHREEISVLRLIGATAGFIRRPLLYRGLVTGLCGGLFACILTGLLMWWLETPAQALVQTYNNTIMLQRLTFGTALLIIASCGLLGLIGAWWAVRRHLA